ncbi:MAG: DMT family transporter, partial [Acinetobacter baumannii]
RIGLSALLGLAIAGQILSSLMIDHFGLLGATERPVSLIKLVGTIVMLVGLTVALLGDKLSEIF